MSAEVWKYLIEGGCTVLAMPRGAKPLTVQAQGYALRPWCLVDPEQPKEQRLFQRVSTGAAFDASKSTYIGTVQEPPLVFHVFEIANQGIPNGYHR